MTQLMTPLPCRHDVSAIARALSRQGIRLQLTPDGNLLAVPKSALTDELRALIHANKPALISHLSTRKVLTKPTKPPAVAEPLTDPFDEAEEAWEEGALSPPLAVLPARDWARLNELLICERGTWHHAEELAARLRLSPDAAGKALEWLHTDARMLERQEVEGRRARAVRGRELIEVEAVYWRVRRAWAEESGLTEDQ